MHSRGLLFTLHLGYVNSYLVELKDRGTLYHIKHYYVQRTRLACTFSFCCLQELVTLLVHVKSSIWISSVITLWHPPT